VRVDLRGEDLKSGRQGAELLSETDNGFPCAALDEFCRLRQRRLENERNLPPYLARTVARTRS
jgi:hypothetical protein